VEAAAMKPTAMEAATMKPTAMEAATMETSMEAAAMEAATMEAATMETAAMETAASVKPAAPTMSSVGEIRLAQRGSEQQSSCGSSQNPARSALNSFSGLSSFLV